MGNKTIFTQSFKGTTRRIEHSFAVIWRYAIEDIMGYRPEEAKDALNQAIVKVLYLDRTLQYVDIPYSNTGYFDFTRALSIVYPNIYHYDMREEVEEEYKKILGVGQWKHNTKQYIALKGFFVGGEGLERAKILLNLAIERFKGTATVSELYEFFSNSQEAKKWMRAVKIWTYIKPYVQIPLDFFHMAYSERSEIMYYNQKVKNIILNDASIKKWDRTKYISE